MKKKLTTTAAAAAAAAWDDVNFVTIICADERFTIIIKSPYQLTLKKIRTLYEAQTKSEQHSSTIEGRRLHYFCTSVDYLLLLYSSTVVQYGSHVHYVFIIYHRCFENFFSV
jgi:hypothetical protein